MKSNLTLKNCCIMLAVTTVLFFDAARGSTVFPIATNASVIEFGAGVASDGTNYLVSLDSGTNVCVQLVSSNGTLIGSLITVGHGAASKLPQIGLVFGRTNYLVAWSDNSISSGVDMFGQFIAPNGAKIGSAFPLLQSVGTHGFQVVQALASDGTNFLVVWQDKNNSSFYGQLVTAGGTLSGLEFLISSQQNNRSATVVFGATNYLVVWQSSNGSQNDINQTYGVLVSRSGSVSSLFQISQTSTPSYNPLTVAFDGTNYLVVWNQDVGPGYPSPTIWNLYGRLVTPAGTILGSELALVTNQTLIPSLAFDGANYLLAYSYDTITTNSDKTLRYRFLDRSANLVGAEFTLFAPQGTNVPLFGSIVFDGTRFAVVADLGAVGIDGTHNSLTNIFSLDVYGTFIPKSTALPQLSVTTPLISGQVPLLLTGTPGIKYSIQMTTNLAPPNWTALVTNSPANGTYNFTDTHATNAGRFYRAVKQ